MSEFKKSDVQAGGDEMFLHRRILTDPKQSPIRIDKFLLDRLEKLSRNRIQNAIKSQCILVDGNPVKANYKVRPNQEITLVLPDPPSEQHEVLPENIPLDIRYEDDHILIVHKEAGMVVHPGVGNYTGTLVNALAYYLANHPSMPLLPGNAPSRPGLVHRIDKNTSGLLVIAKTDEAMTVLAKQFFDHSIEREYVAIVWGNFAELKGTITGHIGRSERDRLRMQVYPDGEKGKEAITHYEVLEDLYYISVVKCVLETGRTHQIRAHMKYAGHPIFNDARYGGDLVVKGTVFTKYKQFVQNCFGLVPRQCLHAKSLAFIHPISGERMMFDSELPEDMGAALEKWRHYIQHRKELL